MSEYKLKGVISEIKVEKNKYQFRIAGVTGYTIKYDKEDYNLFVPETVNTDFENAKIIKKNYLFEHVLDDSLIPFVINCYTNNKPIEVTINEDTTDPDNPIYTILSITALSN